MRESWKSKIISFFVVWYWRNRDYRDELVGRPFLQRSETKTLESIMLFLALIFDQNFLFSFSPIHTDTSEEIS